MYGWLILFLFGVSQQKKSGGKPNQKLKRSDQSPHDFLPVIFRNNLVLFYYKIHSMSNFLVVSYFLAHSLSSSYDASPQMVFCVSVFTKKGTPIQIPLDSSAHFFSLLSSCHISIRWTLIPSSFSSFSISGSIFLQWPHSFP